MLKHFTHLPSLLFRPPSLVPALFLSPFQNGCAAEILSTAGASAQSQYGAQERPRAASSGDTKHFLCLFQGSSFRLPRFYRLQLALPPHSSSYYWLTKVRRALSTIGYGAVTPFPPTARTFSLCLRRELFPRP